MLAITFAAAGLAGKFRVKPREGWSEPVNHFTVTVLLPGERKSAVFSDAIAPIQEAEAKERQRMAPLIAEAESKHRQLKKRLEVLEHQIAKQGNGKASKPGESNSSDSFDLRDEARVLAHQFAAHQVPLPPEFFCDDVTPERLSEVAPRTRRVNAPSQPRGDGV
jgi:hypothetical protein